MFFLIFSQITQYTATINSLLVISIVYSQFLFPFQFLKEVTNAVCDKTIDQPTTQTLRDNVLITQGLVVSYRSFKHGKRSARAIAESEFNTATESLMQDGFGRIVEFRIPRARSTCKVFVKSKPNPWPNCTNITVNEFDIALAKPLHNDITVPMREYLQANNYITDQHCFRQIRFRPNSGNKLRQTTMFIAINLGDLFKSNFSSVDQDSDNIMSNTNVLVFYIPIESQRQLTI